jgi:hypothetical protein
MGHTVSTDMSFRRSRNAFCHLKHLRHGRGSYLFGLAILAAVPFCLSNAAGAEMSNIVTNTIRGRQLVLAAAQHLGGMQPIAAIERFHYALEGEALNGLQGYDPTNLEKALPSGMTMKLVSDLDYKRSKYRRSVSQTLSGGIQFDTVSYYGSGHVSLVFPRTRKITRSEGSQAAIVDSTARYVPVLIVQRALQNLSTATFIGEKTRDGVTEMLVDFSWDPSARVRLHLEKQTKRVLSLEAFQIDPLLGDDVALYQFNGEQKIGGLIFPVRVTLNKRGQPYIETKVTQVEVNPVLKDDLLEPPTDCEPLRQTFQTTPLGTNVYEISGIDGGTFRVIFFDLGDGVAVFDAPQSRATSARVVDEIRKTLGDKPIKYVIISHFHDDHVAGIGYYVDNGAQIVTTRASAPIIERYARTSSLLANDIPARGVPPHFLFVDDEQRDIIGAFGKKVTIYRLDDCPHVKDMLVAYDPVNRLIVEADIYVELAPYSPTSAAFTKWLEKPNSPPVEWFVGPHQGKITLIAVKAAAQELHDLGLKKIERH